MTAMAALTSKIIRAASPLGQNGAKWITRDFSKTRALFFPITGEETKIIEFLQVHMLVNDITKTKIHITHLWDCTRSSVI